MIYLSEENYQKQMDEICVPYLLSRLEDGYFCGWDGHSLHYQIYRADAPRGTVTICHGFTESIPKYRELIFMMLQDGLNVCAYEHRGHGWSYREVENYQYTHLRDFDEYVQDLDCFIAQKVSGLPGPHYLFTHSMGGAVGALWLEKGGSFFSRAALSSPMIAPARMGLPLWFCKALFGSAVFLGFGKKRLFTYDKERGEREWAPVGCDTSKARFDCNEANKRRFRECSNFAPTYGWINQGVRVTKKILAKGAPEEIAVPVCVFNAELDDTVLEPEQRSFIGRVPQGKFVQIEKATHTIFYCVDEVAHPYFDALLSWLR